MKNRYNNSKLAAIDTSSQLWKDLMTGKQFKLSVSKKKISKTQVDAEGNEVHDTYFPNITGVANFKQRVALLSSLKYTSHIVPDLKFRRVGKKTQQAGSILTTQKPPLSSKVSALSRLNITPVNLQIFKK